MRVALVLGGGACVWDDLEAALNLGEFHGVVTCNDVTAAYPGPIDACASLHSNSWGRWLGERASRGYPRPGKVFGHDGAKGARHAEATDEFIEYRFPGQDRSGSSGLFALKVALIDLGFDKAVLCGVPMAPNQRHFFDLRPWGAAHAHRKGWEQALPAMKDRARSMSGWTAELLGQPTEEWLGA